MAEAKIEHATVYVRDEISDDVVYSIDQDGVIFWSDGSIYFAEGKTYRFR